MPDLRPMVPKDCCSGKETQSVSPSTKTTNHYAPQAGRRNTLLWSGIAFLQVLGLAWAFWPSGDAAPTDGLDTSAIERQTLSDDGRNGVTFTATLEGETDGLLVFTVRLDTHSVDLSQYDALKKIQLESGGRTLTATGASEYLAQDSHHVQVRLTFDADPGAVTLVAKDLADVPERRLVYQA